MQVWMRDISGAAFREWMAECKCMKMRISYRSNSILLHTREK